MYSHIRPNTHVALRLPSDTIKVVEAIPNTIISIGKFGAFPANLILGRPYYFTYEILESPEPGSKPRLRVVSPSELNAEILADEVTPAESRAEPADGANGADSSAFDIVAEDGTVVMKNNRLTIDDASRQKLTMEEIEELKRAGTGSGKEIIEKIMKAHSNLDEKTTFSLAKYTLRKAKKYMRRFTVLPVDVGMLCEYMLTEKDAQRTMELREETMGLITAWSNVHYGGSHQVYPSEDGLGSIGGGRWLVVDETGGLMVAALADKMGILYPEEEEDGAGEDEVSAAPEQESNTDTPTKSENGDVIMQDANTVDKVPSETKPAKGPRRTPLSAPKDRHAGELASTNTLHIVHANAQPNLSLLKYFSYDTNNPSITHPLHSHLKQISWLQLIDPSSDTTYAEPETVPASVLDSWKSGKRGTYFKKRRRWERCKSTVDETRAGGFDGLVVASAMDPSTILKHTLPLIRGAGHVVVYSPTVEPLTQLMDLYSRDRKAAFIGLMEHGVDAAPSEDDFPVDPRLLLAPSLQTSRVRPFQVLPGRTHPLMTSRGASEGYVFTARRVVPVEGKVEARGNFSKKRKVG